MNQAECSINLPNRQAENQSVKERFIYLAILFKVSNRCDNNEYMVKQPCLQTPIATSYTKSNGVILLHISRVTREAARKRLRCIHRLESGVKLRTDSLCLMTRFILNHPIIFSAPILTYFFSQFLSLLFYICVSNFCFQIQITIEYKIILFWVKQGVMPLRRCISLIAIPDSFPYFVHA